MILEVTSGVNTFRNILMCSWEYLTILSAKDTTRSFLDDWMQANWERVVEGSIDPNLNVVIEPYGDGADCNIRSSRVWHPESKSNTPVYVRYIGNQILENVINGNTITGSMQFDRFCAVRNHWPVTDAPFDHVLLLGNDVAAIPARDLEYYVDLGGT